MVGSTSSNFDITENAVNWRIILIQDNILGPITFPCKRFSPSPTGETASGYELNFQKERSAVIHVTSITHPGDHPFPSHWLGKFSSYICVLVSERAVEVTNLTGYLQHAR